MISLRLPKSLQISQCQLSPRLRLHRTVSRGWSRRRRRHRCQATDTPAATDAFWATLVGTALEKARPQLGKGFLAGGCRAGIGEVVGRQRGRARRAHKGRGRKTQTAAGSPWACEAGLLLLLVGPVEQGGDDLQDLEFARVGSVEGEKVQEVVRDDLAVAERQ